MKLIIHENQRGFLYRNGTFRKMLNPGAYRVKKLLGESVHVAYVHKEISLTGVNPKVFMKDKTFAENVSVIDVPDNHIALHFEDGRIISALRPGAYYFWQIFQRHDFDLVDISAPEITLPKKQVAAIPKEFYTKIEVPEGEAGLLFYDGKFEKLLKSGSYFFWNGIVKTACQLVDLRAQQLDVNSQEILTADKVTLRMNFVCTYQIQDPVKINNSLKDYKTQVYVTTQLALREYVGKLKFDELLEQKDSIPGIVLEKLRQKEAALYIKFLDAGLKDIILPGEIRDIMNTVLIAEKNAQANVISRREEVASTRSLLNTAKLMDENKTLYKLKELEYLERICDRVGNISVGNGDLLGQLSEFLSPNTSAPVEAP